jgi:hypothetical protein
MGKPAEIVGKSIRNCVCPKCHALPGERCRDPNNRDITHGERLNAPSMNQND